MIELQFTILDLNIEDIEIKVENIVNHMVDNYRKYVFYVRWLGYNDEDNTWVKHSEFYSDDIINDYMKDKNLKYKNICIEYDHLYICNIFETLQIESCQKKGEETTKSVNYTITGNTSVSIGDNNSIINNIEDVQKKEKKRGDSDEKEHSDEYIYEEEERDKLIYEEEDNDEYISEGEDGDKYISEEDSDDNDNIPSDLTIDHHPSRDCEYFFGQERVSGEVNDHGEIAQDEWVVGDLCVSEKC
ncbi:hypothetical protein K501DRAFT_314692, partial [Backusella circina FSU 941]